MKIITLSAIILTSLVLSGCNIIGIQYDQSNVSTQQNQEVTANKLDISNKALTRLPDYIIRLDNLEELNISNNKLTGSLPAEIKNLSKLKILDLSNNLMTGIPAEIGQLPNLEILNLANNQLTGLPYELGNLKNLKTLNLSGNNYAQPDLDVILKTLPSDVKIITN
ncbi:leucine-rich repeat domain-containing protein [Candidatus Falkowbacteria bacterium]|nr:leucine-rich repeat domain-containing protein [Candidatus Falkowbacteria bacterium]